MFAALLLQGILDGLGAEDPAVRDRATAVLLSLEPDAAPRLEAMAAGRDLESAARLRESAAFLRWKGRFSPRLRMRFPGLLDVLRRGTPGELARLLADLDVELRKGGLELREAVPVWIEGVSDERESPVPLIYWKYGGGSDRPCTIDELSRDRLYGVFGNCFRGERKDWRAWWAPLADRPELEWHLADLAHESPARRACAIRRLGERTDVTTAERLRREIERLPSYFRRGLSRRFEDWPPEARRNVLEPLLDDRDPEVRAEAAEVLR